MDTKKLNKLLSWIVTIAALSSIWPVGLFLLFRLLKLGYLIPPEKLSQFSSPPVKPYETSAREVYDTPKAAPRAEQRRSKPYSASGAGSRSGEKRAVPVKKHWGLGLRIAGWFVGGIGALGTLVEFPELFSSSPDWGDLSLAAGLLATGLVLLGFGFSRKKKSRRYRRYLSLIGTRENVSLDSLAEAIPVSFEKACADLQDMIEEGFLPAAGRVDRTRRRLILSGGLEDMPPVRPAGDESGGSERAVLAEIREVNDRIPDPVMSEKIDRIEEITGKILDYKRQNPDSAGELQSFLNYYLPTTLKLLRSYAQMEEQGVEGRNIRQTKASIEAAMDKVVEGFEKRLDKLFRTDAIDITSDIQVLEQMLRRDGLAEDELLTLEL